MTTNWPKVGCLLAAVGSFVWLLAVAVRPAGAYVLSGEHWPNNQPIVMELSLGATPVTLEDNSGTWDKVAEAAFAIWNPYLGNNVQFVAKETTASPGHDDGINQVFFDNAIYGEAFGDDTLAITLSRFDSVTKIKSEADVIVNSATPLNSYRGSVQETTEGRTLFDLRRILLHEFGHVLGLAHTPESSQSIMVPYTNDIDMIQPDDIAGVEAIYGSPLPDVPVVASKDLNANGILNHPFAYRIGATNNPSSFTVSGLPEGLTFNAFTGIIDGSPTVAGTYHVTIGATNAAGTGTATLTLIFAPVPAITSSLQAMAYVGYPFYYRITANGSPIMYGVLAETLPAGLTLDPAAGLISGTPTVAGTFTIRLAASNVVTYGSADLALTVEKDAALAVLYTVNGSNFNGLNITSLTRGSDGNLYGSAGGGGPGAGGTLFRCAPDGTYTTIYDFNRTGPGEPAMLRQAADGSFYGTTDYGGVTGQGIIFKLTADGTLTTLASLSPPSHAAPSASVLQAGDGNYYGTLSVLEAGRETGLAGSIFKLTPGGTLTTIHQFTNGGQAVSPNPLIQARDGNFYGTTQSANYPDSTIFRLTPDGAFTTLHTLTTAEGAYCSAPLIQASDGNFYGTAYGGGTGSGTVFKVTPDGAFTVLHTFTGNEGSGATGLAQGIDGNFYGVITNVPSVYLGCSIFKMTPDGVLSIVHAALGNEGINLFLPLIANADGTFYGGSANTIFKVTPGATPPVPPVVALAVTTPKTTVGGDAPGVFTLTLALPLSTAITVYYTVKGSAVNGTDYVYLNGKKKIKAGKTSKPINVVPLGDLGGEARKAVKIILQADSNYTVGTPLPAKVKIFAAHGGEQ